MKKFFKIKRSLVCILAIVMSISSSFVACKRKTGEEIDSTKTQLYVRIHDGGYGTSWFTNFATRFEEKYKDVVFEEGKKGVQIVPDANKNLIQSVSDITGSRNEVFFAEQLPEYIGLVNNGAFLDITDIVTESVESNKTDYNPNGTIVDRLTNEQKDYLCVNGKYYGIPHYASYFGFQYDVDVFEREGNLCLYFGEDGNFVKDPTDVTIRSKGPDNIKGTYDDGLPATYDQFFKLLDRMVATNLIPIVWSGDSLGYYGFTLAQLYAQAEGADQYFLNFSLSGQAENIVESVVPGRNFESTQIKTKTVNINNSNGYQLYSQAGRYYATKFFEKIVKNYTKYLHPSSFTTGHSHLDAEFDFVSSKYDSGSKRVAMILEGTWWENEVSPRLTDMEVMHGVEASRKNRNFAFLPLPAPKALEDGEEHKNVLLQDCKTLGFINSGIADFKKPLAKAFLQAFYSETELIEFTVTTNTPIGINYEIPEAKLKEMSPYGRSLLTVVQNSEILATYSQHPYVLNRFSSFDISTTFQAEIQTQAGLVTKDNLLYAFRYDNVSAEDFFNGMVSKYDLEWWNNNIV